MLKLRALLLAALGLGFAACQPTLDPKLLVGNYLATSTAVQAPGEKEAKASGIRLTLAANDQALYWPETESLKSDTQKGRWSVSGNELTLVLFKLDPATLTGAKQDKGGRLIVDATLKLRVERSTRSLWLEEAGSTKKDPHGLHFIRQ